MRKDFREKKRKEGSRTEEGRVKEINWPEMLREGGGDRPASQYIRCHRNELIYCLIPNGWGHLRALRKFVVHQGCCLPSVTVRTQLRRLHGDAE